MIGNIEGVDERIDNRTFRIFSEPTNPQDSDFQKRMRRYYGGEVDGISRQLARYIYTITKTYMPEMNPMMIYRLDRFGHGGHHRPFCDTGFAGVRIMEAHESYYRQHQDVRMKNGIEYGDVIGVSILNTRKTHISQRYHVSRPSPRLFQNQRMWPFQVRFSLLLRSIGTRIDDEELAGYKVYFRETTSSTWDKYYILGKGTTQFTLEGIVIDNYFFGVAAVGKD